MTWFNLFCQICCWAGFAPPRRWWKWILFLVSLFELFPYPFFEMWQPLPGNDAATGYLLHEFFPINFKLSLLNLHYIISYFSLWLKIWTKFSHQIIVVDCRIWFAWKNRHLNLCLSLLRFVLKKKKFSFQVVDQNKTQVYLTCLGNGKSKNYILSSGNATDEVAQLCTQLCHWCNAHKYTYR